MGRGRYRLLYFQFSSLFCWWKSADTMINSDTRKLNFHISFPSTMELALSLILTSCTRNISIIPEYLVDIYLISFSPGIGLRSCWYIMRCTSICKLCWDEKKNWARFNDGKRERKKRHAKFVLLQRSKAWWDRRIVSI